MALRRRRAARVGPVRQPAVPQAVCLPEAFRQQPAPQRVACRPVVRGTASSRHQEPGLRRERTIQQPEERRDVPAAARQACCRALASRSGQQVPPGELREPQASERALPSGLVPSGEVAPQGPL